MNQTKKLTAILILFFLMYMPIKAAQTVQGQAEPMLQTIPTRTPTPDPNAPTDTPFPTIAPTKTPRPGDPTATAVSPTD
ncbi:MAG: hypothetical protein ACE5EY_16430, partial [Anaerolineae bacterium]